MHAVPCGRALKSLRGPRHAGIDLPICHVINNLSNKSLLSIIPYEFISESLLNAPMLFSETQNRGLF